MNFLSDQLSFYCIMLFLIKNLPPKNFGGAISAGIIPTVSFGLIESHDVIN